MKRSLDLTGPIPSPAKKPKLLPGQAESLNLDGNLLFEILKHVDARTLGRAACVSRQWNRAVQDERLWEMMCTKHWPSNQQLRSVVLALGGFRRLHSLYLWPLTKPNSAPARLPPLIGGKTPSRWGRDEMQVSLSLLSIKYFEKMNFRGRLN